MNMKMYVKETLKCEKYSITLSCGEPDTTDGESVFNVGLPGGRFLKNLTTVRRRKPIRLTMSYV